MRRDKSTMNVAELLISTGMALTIWAKDGGKIDPNEWYEAYAQMFDGMVTYAEVINACLVQLPNLLTALEFTVPASIEVVIEKNPLHKKKSDESAPGETLSSDERGERF